MAPQTQIPFDVIETILHQLCDNIGMLKTTSLVSHSFLASSQRYLFAKTSLWINYYTKDGHAKPKQLLSLFTAKPELALYVKDFRFSTTGEGGRSFDQEAHTDSLILSICQLLKNIRSLTLFTRWDLLTRTCRFAILELCNCAQLDHIDAMGLHAFPMTRFSRMSQITRITLRGTGNSYLAAQEAPSVIAGRDVSPKVKGHLEVLEFDEDVFHSKTPERFSTTLTHPQTLLSISHLRLLKLNGNTSELMDEAWKIMQVAERTLEYFIWDVRSPKWGRPRNNTPHVASFGTIDISHMPNLRFLALGIGEHLPNDEWILESLARMAGHNRLQRLVVVINPQPHPLDSLDVLEFLTHMDARLARGDFPHLAAVTIYLGVGGPNFSPSWTIDARAAMPLLGKAGILTVESIDAVHRNSGPLTVDKILATYTPRQEEK